MESFHLVAVGLICAELQRERFFQQPSIKVLAIGSLKDVLITDIIQLGILCGAESIILPVH